MKMATAGQGGLPSGFTRKSYISMAANAAFDTGIQITNSHKVETDFYRTGSSAMYFYGALSTGNTKSCTAYFSASAGSGNWRWGNTAVSISVSTGRHTAVQDNGGVTFDGSLKTYSGTPATFATPYSLSIGRAHNADGSYGTAQYNGRLYSLKIYLNDALIADFVPATDAGGEYGMFDVVRRRWFPSETGTPFSGA